MPLSEKVFPKSENRAAITKILDVPENVILSHPLCAALQTSAGAKDPALDTDTGG